MMPWQAVVVMAAGWVAAAAFAGLAWRYWSRVGYFRAQVEHLRRWLVQARKEQDK